MAIIHYKSEGTTNSQRKLNLKLKIDNHQITPNLNTAQMSSLANMVNDKELKNFKKIELIKK